MALAPIDYDIPGTEIARIQPGRLTYEPRSLPELIEWARTVCNSDIVPKEMRGKAENVILAVQHGNELGLSCAQSLQSIYVVNGRPSVYGDTMLAIVKASGMLAEFSEGLQMDENGKVIAAICYARRVGEPEHEPTVFSWADAMRAKLPERNALYSQFPQRMLKFKARAYELRDNFPDLLKGIQMVEEMRDILDVEASVSAADRIAEARERMRKPVTHTAPKPAEAPPKPTGDKEDREDLLDQFLTRCDELEVNPDMEFRLHIVNTVLGKEITDFAKVTVAGWTKILAELPAVLHKQQEAAGQTTLI